MSITASYRRLSPMHYQSLLDDPKAAAAAGLYDPKHSDYFEDDLDEADFDEALEKSGRLLDIQKEWHALHFLLTGRAEMDKTEEPPPLGNVVLGGTPTPWEATYNHVRFLSPEEVKAVAAALQGIKEEELRRRDLNAFTAADLYSYDDDPWTADDLEMLIDVFVKVRAFFSEAARQGDVILLSSD